jgi:DNA (cytosine-5)-methyltransferase 1
LENVAGHLTLGFADVLADLTAIGFDAEWAIVPASWTGAPHRRDRLIIVAYSQEHQLYERHHHGECPEISAITTRELGRSGSDEGRPDGRWWALEPSVGRVAHGVPHRVDRLRALGNAVVPQVAEYVGRRLMKVAA